MANEGSTLEAQNRDGIHSVVEGDGPWVTLIHALACDHTMWDPQVRPLVAAGHRVLCYDVRGHGLSASPTGPCTMQQMAAELSRLLDSLGVKRTHLVGLSMGGMIAQAFAAEHGDKLQSLVLSDTTSCSPEGARQTWAERLRLARTLGMDALVESTLERWFTPAFRRANPPRLEAIANAIRRTQVAGYEACVEAILAFDMTTRLKEIEAPCLVLVGEQDGGTPPAVSRALHENLEGSEFAIIAEAGHLSNVERPAEFTAQLVRFLGRNAGNVAG